MSMIQAPEVEWQLYKQGFFLGGITCPGVGRLQCELVEPVNAGESVTTLCERKQQRFRVLRIVAGK